MEKSTAIDKGQGEADVGSMVLEPPITAFTSRAHRREKSVRSGPPPQQPSGPTLPVADSLLAAALEAHDNALPSGDLAIVWQDVLDGRLTFAGEGRGASRHLVLARTTRLPRALNRVETAILVRVLCGEQQKLVAAELGIACSTASRGYTLALAKLKLCRGLIPLPLVIAAQSWASGSTLPVNARSTVFEREGCEFFLLSVPRPAATGGTGLTHAEEAVARLLVEGSSRGEIAVLRSTSEQTVACQLRGIFSKLRLAGRHALIRHAVEQGWFRSTVSPGARDQMP